MGTIAAGIRARSFTSISGVPTHLGRFIYEGLNYGPQLGIRYRDQGVKALSAGWAQIDLSYARILHAAGFSMWSVGATARYLQGIYGAGVQFDVLEYTVIDSMRAQVHEATGSYGYATPGLGAGQGWGLTSVSCMNGHWRNAIATCPMGRPRAANPWAIATA